MNKFVFVVLSIILWWLSGCERISTPLTPALIGKPDIRYTVQGGFIGGILQKVSISAEGLASYETVYPVLRMQLTPAEHQKIIRLFTYFHGLKEKYPGGCMDDITYIIEYSNPGFTKTVSIDACVLFNKGSQPEVQILWEIVMAMQELANRIYEQKAPWIGLEVDYHLDQEVYGLQDTIVFTYRITNPTDRVRALFFQHQSQFYFQVLQKLNFPSFYYFYPPQEPPDTSQPSHIVLQPGEHKDIIYRWDRSLGNQQGQGTFLDIGYYFLRMGLMNGNLGFGEFWFEVLDKRLPVGGVIIADEAVESPDSPVYVFQLAVRNWTENNVTLHFPYRQKLNIQLYDLKGTQPGSLLYEGPREREPWPSEVSIPAEEFRIFQHSVPKDSLNLSYMWYYARVELLCSDFLFSRDGQLRIFKYRP